MSFQNLIFQAQGIVVVLVSGYFIRSAARLSHLQLSLGIIHIASSKVCMPIIVAILFLFLIKVLLSMLISLVLILRTWSSYLPVAIAFNCRSEVGSSYLVLSGVIS